jgi:hypothetical protein
MVTALVGQSRMHNRHPTHLPASKVIFPLNLSGMRTFSLG